MKNGDQLRFIHQKHKTACKFEYLIMLCECLVKGKWKNKYIRTENNASETWQKSEFLLLKTMNCTRIS